MRNTAGMSKRVIRFRFQPLQAEFDPGKDSHIVIHASRANLDPKHLKALIDLVEVAKVKVALLFDKSGALLEEEMGKDVHLLLDTHVNLFNSDAASMPGIAETIQAIGEAVFGDKFAFGDHKADTDSKDEF
jgi:hypothetical protein